MVKLNNAKYIKSLFIDNVLNNRSEDLIIGSEVMFAYKKVVADLVVLSNGTSEAYEIKAQNDDFRKIISQLEEYNNVFDFVNVIVTENHFEKAKNLIPLNNGIFIVTNNQNFEIYRQPTQNFNLNKVELISTMTIKFILKHYNIRSNKNSANEIRNLLIEKGTEELKEAVYIFLHNRISYKFNNFLLERGNKTHFEDIILLSMPNKRIFL